MQRNIVFTVSGSFLRFAPHFYNSEDEIEKAATALNEIEL